MTALTPIAPYKSICAHRSLCIAAMDFRNCGQSVVCDSVSWVSELTRPTRTGLKAITPIGARTLAETGLPG
jgi:hypothetical protein